MSLKTISRKATFQFPVSIVAMLLLLTLAGQANASPYHVSVQLQWKHQFEFAGFYAAEAKGYYRDAGLSVDFLEYENEMAIVDDVVAGRKTFGLTNSELILARLQGAPVVMLANYFKRSPLVIVTRPHMQTPTDLRGKTLMIAPNDFNNINVRRMFKTAGVSADTLNIVPSTFDINDFINGKVDAMAAYLTNEIFLLHQKQVPFTLIDPNAYSTLLYDMNLFTSETFAKQHPDKVRAMVQATKQGWYYALSHQDEIIDLILSRYNTQKKTREQLQFEAQEVSKLMLSALFPVGSIDPARVYAIAEMQVHDNVVNSVDALQGFVYKSDDEMTEKIELTEQEKAYIKAHPVIRVSNENDYPPFDFTIGDEAQGYSVDLIKILAARIGLKIEFVNGHTWTELLDLFKTRQLDLMHSIHYLKEREQFGLYSKPYTRFLTRFATRRDRPDITDISQLYGKKVAVGKGWSQHDFLAQYHPQVHLLPKKNLEAMLEAVSTGEADATVESDGIMKYFIKTKGLRELKITGWLQDFDQGGSKSFYFLAQKDAPALISMLDKALASLTAADIDRLEQRWFGVDEAIQPDQRTVSFTPAEENYLTQKGAIKMCVYPNWMPFERINENGQHEGMSAELLQLASERAGLTLTLVKTDSWNESIEAAKSRRCDILSLAMATPERSTYMHFTTPYLSFPLVIAARSEQTFVEHIDSLWDKPLGMVKGYAIADILKQRYPHAHFVEIDSLQQGLARVRAGEVYGLIDALAAIGYVIRENAMTDVKIISKLDDNWELSVATRNDEPLLRDIMQKAISSLTLREKQQAKNRWFSIRVEQGFDYPLLWKILGAVTLIVLGIVYWNRRLARFSKEIQAKNVLIESQHQQVTSALQQVATLLDNSGQGFLSFGKNLRIDSAYSRECQRIFQCEALDQSIETLLYPDDVERQRFLRKTLTLAMATTTDALRRDALFGLLPRLYHLNGCQYNAEYKLVAPEKIMLILTDITDEMQLRERVAEERQRLEFIVNAMENRNELLDMLHEYQEFRTQTLPTLLMETSHADVLRSEISRRIHTFKSLFAQSKLPTMTHTLHALETRLSQLREQASPCTVSNIKQVLGQFDLGAGLEQDLALLREKLGDDYFTHDKDVRVTEATLDHLEHELTSIEGCNSITACLESRQRALNQIVQLRFVPLRGLLESHFRAAELLAQRMGKPIADIIYEGDTLLVDPKLFGPFCKSLVHVFRNAVDHGIEDADTRALRDKPELGHIRCKAYANNEQLTLVIDDDGRGLDAAAIQTTAVARGLLALENAVAMAEADIFSLLFREGFSTSTSVSDISGRGIGLNAVYEELQKLRGQVTVQSTPGQNTRFTFTLPYPHLTLPTSHGEQRERDRAAALLAPFLKVAQNYCAKHLQLALNIDATPLPMSKTELLDFSALIPLGSGLNASLGLSLERPLLHQMTRRFDPAFAEADVASLANSVGAEVANTLVGNTTVYFTPQARHVNIGLPITLDVSDYFDQPDVCQAYCLKGNIEEHKFYLFCLFALEDIP